MKKQENCTTYYNIFCFVKVTKVNKVNGNNISDNTTFSSVLIKGYCDKIFFLKKVQILINILNRTTIENKFIFLK